MNVWAVMILGGLLTYGIRLSFIFLLGRLSIPVAGKRALRFVPSAVLSAIIAPALLLPEGRLDLTPGNFRLLAGAVAILVAWRTKNALLTIAAGMGALLVLTWTAGGL
ncbi:MAG: AzlD domain-containing protein [Anaerolineales bacterium]